MKRIISLALCVLMLFSVVSVCAVAAEAPSASDLMYVKSSDVKNGLITYTVYLRKNISVAGGVISAGFDDKVLEVVENQTRACGKVDEDENVTANVPGMYVKGLVADKTDTYSFGYTYENPTSYYKTGSSDKAFIQFTFKVIDSTRPIVNVDFYCAEFLSAEEEMSIPSNLENPQKFESVEKNTFENPVIVSVTPAAKGMQITWKPAEGAAYYRLYKATDEGGWIAWQENLSAQTTSFIDESARHGVKETYAVRAFNADNYSNKTYEKVTGLYVAPVSKITTANTGDAVKISWSAVSGANIYRLYKRVTNADGSKTAWETIVSSTTAKTYTDSNVANNVKYEYIVRAQMNKVWNANSAASAIYHYDAPTVKIASVTGGAKITWNEIEGAETYRIYRKLNGAKSWTAIKDVEAGTLSYIDAGATSGKKIDYTVKVLSSKGNSNYVAKTIDYVATPKLTSLSNGTSGFVVKWGAVTGANSYRVYRKASGEKSWTLLATVKTTSYTDKTAKSGTTYAYTVKAFKDKVASGYDAKGISLKYLEMPKLTKLTNSSTGIVVKWNAVAGASSGYRVYRKAAGESSWTNMGTVKTNSFTDKKVTNGKTYTYTVRAVSGSTLSAYNTKGLSIKRVK